jgi:exopolyphosphatase/guanosine-5'-triphosphate,3'-diphosphate pyrophosphatase
MSSSRIAVLDVGSNSFHLVVTEVPAIGAPRPIDRAKEMVRLGETALADRMISPDAFARGQDALGRLAARARSHAPEAIVAVATSAVREARNGAHFVEVARERHGVSIRIIDGIEEARFTYLGACEALGAVGRRVALFDMGGGSTEALVGQDRDCLYATSLKLGVLRLLPGSGLADPITAADRHWLRSRVDETMAPTVRRMQRIGFDFVAFTSGTAVALARLAGDPLSTRGGSARFRLTAAALADVEERLARMNRASRARLPGLEPKRADTIVPGAVALRTILELTGATEAEVCNAALREGMLIDYLDGRRVAAAL